MISLLGDILLKKRLVIYRVTMIDNDWPRVTSCGTASDNEWHRVNDNEWHRVVKQMSTSDIVWYSKWQWMKSDNEWQRLKKYDTEWQQITASDKTNEYEWVSKIEWFHRKTPCWSLFLINLQAWRLVTLLKRDSNVDVFLWILCSF